MEWLQVLLLSLLQGITEFLPISSSGHLIALPYLVHWPEQGVFFDLCLHFGTLLAVMLYFYRDMLALCRGTCSLLLGKYQHHEARRALNVMISTLPLVAVAAFTHQYLEAWTRVIPVLAISIILFGFWLWYADTLPEQEDKDVARMTPQDALWFGFYQVLALIPGTSRSGITMTAGRMLGYSRSESAHYSMLMAVPVLLILCLSAIVSELRGKSLVSNHAEPVQIIVGTVVSFIVALVVIHLLLKWVGKIGFLPFVIYRFLMGVGLLWLWCSAY